MKRVYLAHPRYMKGKLENFKKELRKLGFEVIDPFEQDYQEGSTKTICYNDLKLVESSDLVIGYYITTGVAVELKKALERNIPTYVLADYYNQGNPFAYYLGRWKLYSEEGALLKDVWRDFVRE